MSFVMLADERPLGAELGATVPKSPLARSPPSHASMIFAIDPSGGIDNNILSYQRTGQGTCLPGHRCVSCSLDFFSFHFLNFVYLLVSKILAQKHAQMIHRG